VGKETLPGKPERQRQDRKQFLSEFWWPCILQPSYRWDGHSAMNYTESGFWVSWYPYQQLVRHTFSFDSESWEKTVKQHAAAWSKVDMLSRPGTFKWAASTSHLSKRFAQWPQVRLGHLCSGHISKWFLILPKESREILQWLQTRAKRNWRGSLSAVHALNIHGTYSSIFAGSLAVFSCLLQRSSSE